jgi:hypothetical protein
VQKRKRSILKVKREHPVPEMYHIRLHMKCGHLQANELISAIHQCIIFLRSSLSLQL